MMPNVERCGKTSRKPQTMLHKRHSNTDVQLTRYSHHLIAKIRKPSLVLYELLAPELHKTESEIEKHQNWISWLSLRAISPGEKFDAASTNTDACFEIETYKHRADTNHLREQYPSHCMTHQNPLDES